MALTDTQIRKFKPNGKVQKYTDGRGLRLEVTKIGTKFFKFRFTLDGKDSDFTIGEYPAVTLSQARKSREHLAEKVREGINPNHEKQNEKLKRLEMREQEKHIKGRITFSKAYDKFCKYKTAGPGNINPEWTYDTLQKHNLRFNKHVLPILGDKPLEELTVNDLEDVLLAIQKKGIPSVLRKVRTVFNNLFGWCYGQTYSSGDKWIEQNPAKLITDAIFYRYSNNNFKHIDEEKGISEFLLKLKSLKAKPEVYVAIHVAFHTFVRPSNASSLRWSQIDFDEQLIRYSAEDMKMDKGFLVPMSRQVEQLLKEIQSLTEYSDYVFQSPNSVGISKPISRDSLSSALRKNGIINITPHGFRHTASTALNNLGCDAEVIELSLAHTIKGSRGVYNKATKLDQRRVLMQTWSDYIDCLGGNE